MATPSRNPPTRQLPRTCPRWPTRATRPHTRRTHPTIPQDRTYAHLCAPLRTHTRVHTHTHTRPHPQTDPHSRQHTHTHSALADSRPTPRRPTRPRPCLAGARGFLPGGRQACGTEGQELAEARHPPWPVLGSVASCAPGSAADACVLLVHTCQVRWARQARSRSARRRWPSCPRMRGARPGPRKECGPARAPYGRMGQTVSLPLSPAEPLAVGLPAPAGEAARAREPCGERGVAPRERWHPSCCSGAWVRTGQAAAGLRGHRLSRLRYPACPVQLARRPPMCSDR